MPVRRSIFDDHLRFVDTHQFEEDIERNLWPDIVSLERGSPFGTSGCIASRSIFLPLILGI